MGSALGAHPHHKPTQLSDYKLGYILGKGGFATVYHATHLQPSLSSSGNIDVAIKKIDIQEKKYQLKKINTALIELNVLKLVRKSSFIVQLLAAFHDETCCCLVLTSLTGGDLRYHLKCYETFTEHRVAYLIACISSALCHLHALFILHRDIKPENIILDHHGVPHLTDFGTSYIIPRVLGLSSTLHSTTAAAAATTTVSPSPLCSLSSGTFPYLAPEVLTPSHRHSFQSDFWSLGVTAYEILFHQRPYEKHCPKDFVYFVDNYYSHYWDYLEETTAVTIGTALTATAPTATAPTPAATVTATGPNNSQRQSLKSFSSSTSSSSKWKHAPSSDMNHIITSLLPSPTRETIPHPNHYIPYSFLPNEEPLLTLPSSLITPIPMRTACKDLVSSECHQFFTAALDVRIHKRLGNNSRDVSSHCWFQKYSLDFHTLSQYPAPFRPNVKNIQKTLYLRESANQQQPPPQQQSQEGGGTGAGVGVGVGGSTPLLSSKPMTISPHSLARSTYAPPAVAAAAAPSPLSSQEPPNSILFEVQEKLSQFSYHPNPSSLSSSSSSSTSFSQSFSLARFGLKPTAEVISKTESA
jgi:serine/threonine protein kinase